MLGYSQESSILALKIVLCVCSCATTCFKQGWFTMLAGELQETSFFHGSGAQISSLAATKMTCWLLEGAQREDFENQQLGLAIT